MNRPRSLARFQAFVVFATLSGCAHNSHLTISSAEWDPQTRASVDAVKAGKSPGTDAEIQAAAKGLKPVRTSSQTQPKRNWTFDPLYILSFPAFLIWDGLRHVVVTDVDPTSRPRFETQIFFAPDEPSIGDSEPFEVQVKYIAIDQFTGGRLRDAWGGQGGQVSVQTSLNALSDAGMPISEDTTFVVENEVKRRSPLLALAKGTAKGREFTDKVTDRAKALLEKVADLDLTLEKVKGWVQEVKDATGADGRAKKLAELRKKATEHVDEWVAKNVKGADETEVAKQLADSIVSSVFDEIERRLGDSDIDKIANWVDTVTAKAARHLDQATAVLDYFGRYGVDENGIYESAKIIVGLADADRRATIEFENVKPSLLQFPGEAGGGTAATLIGDDLNSEGEKVLEKPYWSSETSSGGGVDKFHATARDDQVDKAADPAAPSSTNPVVTSRGLVYRGTLKELSRSMSGVKGISLSFLMLDRGDDRVVLALRTLQAYSEQSGITVGGGGTEIQLAAIIEGLAALAERISEDKVELRSIDVRFLSGSPRSGATPGRELFALRPCTLLISRNLSGNSFGAVAEISISKVR